MQRYKYILMLGVVCVCLFLLLPVVKMADARDDVSVAVVSPELQKEIDAAGPGDLVTAIVRMRSRGPSVRAQSNRADAFTALRQNARISQGDLVSFLDQASVKPRIGVVRQFWIDNIVLVQAPKDVIAQIAQRPDVEKVFDNFTVSLPPLELEDPEPLSHQTQPWDNIAWVGAEQVWSEYGLTGGGIRVGGLDTGVDISHPDIAGKMITTNPADPTYPGGWAEFDSNGNIIPGSVPHDSDQHGTHTTGTMIGGNASGYDVGVAPSASLIHGLVIPGGSGSFAQVVGGMEWIIDPDGDPMTDDGAQVVNMSLGATGTFPEMIAPTDNMVAAGVFPSFSIGNSGPGSSTTGSPGNVPSAYGVGATDSGDVIASFSSRGPVTWNNPPYVGTYIKPDISAPGVQIFSTVPGGDWEWQGVGFTWSGTSMAAPHVSGTVALMRQANPSLTVAEIKQILAQTALDLGDTGMDNSYGWGRVNCYAAVSQALVGVGTLAGTISSSGGGPVEGAMVLITDTGQRVFTDAIGHYSLSLVAGDHTVEVSRFGYETNTANTTIVADMTTTLDLTLNQLPSGTVAGTVSDEGTGVGISANISVKLGGEVVVASATDPVTGAYSILLPVGTYDLVFSPVFPYPMTTRMDVEVFEAMTTTVDVPLMPGQILIVDDDKGDAYEAYYETAVAGAGRSYLTVNTPPTAADMSLFEAVVWFTGDDYTTTLTTDDQAEIAAYLDGGGRLFITGQDIGYDIRTAAFYTDYLHATYVQDDAKLGAVYGNPASPVGTGFAFDIKGGTGANNQAYASEIDPIAPAMTAFFYNEDVPEAVSGLNAASKMGDGMSKADVGAQAITSSGSAAITYENSHRLVYFAFGFEAIANESDRIAVMDRVLDWLQGYPEIAHTPLGDTEDTENPYPVTAVITSDYFPLDLSSFAVVYSTGGPDYSVPMTPTGVPDEYEAQIPAQPIDSDVGYYITASDVEGHTSTDPLGAPALRYHFSVAKDVIPPEVVHTRIFDTNDLTGPYVVRAEVTDNIGVEAVYVLYRKNGGMLHRVEMEPQSPEYVGEIPGPSEVGDVYEYYILAMDESYSGNATRVPETGVYQFAIVEEFVWDFEMDDGGFTPSGGVWEWGAPTSGPGMAHSGMNLWATVLNGNYPNSGNATLDLPAITIGSDKQYAVFSFWHWYNLENRWDGGNVKVSTDGGTTFQIITPARGYDDIARTSNKGIPSEPCFTDINEYWQEDAFDLSAFKGQQVIIRLHFGSDTSVQRPGWYVDDVRLRGSDVDDVAPSITNVAVPASTFDTAGPYTVTADVRDLFSGLASVAMYYSLNGGSFTQVPMTPGADDEWSASIPGLAQGTRVRLYLEAADNAGNVSRSPLGAPADAYAFSILPSAPTLVLLSSNVTGGTLEEYRSVLEANGHEADYWSYVSQGSEVLDHLDGYENIVLEETSSMTTSERAAYAAFLQSGTIEAKKGFFVLARSIGLSSSNRPFILEYLRSEYVQNSAGWNEITGEPGDPIGIGETFLLDGTSIDEIKRTNDYPGGVIVYRFTAPGNAEMSPEEYGETLEKYGEDWDGVMPNAPISLDAACGMRYNGETYRSVYLTWDISYVQEDFRREGILDRGLRWLASPEIVHDPLPDTEDASNPYVVTALVYSDDLDPSRVRLHYDVGAGVVTVGMTPTGNPNEWSGSIPAQPLGTTVHYYLSAANTDGNTSYHPPTAPTDKHTFEVNADITPPVIVHVPMNSTADVIGPYVIKATVTDNAGVASVDLTWRKNGGGTTTVAMTNTGGDNYEASIPGPSVLGDIYEYFILATDIAAVPNTERSPDTGFHSLEIVDFYAWDFEADDGGFTAGGPDWEWGAPTTGPGNANSGVNVWATKLGGNYSASSNSTLDLPEVVVPTSKSSAVLSFWQWYYIETNYDGGNVKVSTDGGTTWTILDPDIGYNGTARTSNAAIPGEPCFTGYNDDFWHKVRFNLTPYIGQAVIIRLHFGSDSSVHRVGWYVDDVRIDPADDTEGPVFASVELPTSTFDTTGPYPVTATVNDLLSGVATVNLNYSTDDGVSWTTVPMTPTGQPNEYTAGIPGQSSGTRIKHYLEATDNAANVSVSPDGAPGITYEFGILPSGDFLVLLDGAFHTAPAVFQTAFATLGRSADIIDWDDIGTGGVSVSLLEAYETVIIDHSFYFVTAQLETLSTWLDRADGTRQRIVFYGDDLSSTSTVRPFMEQYSGLAYVKGTTGWNELQSPPGDPIGNGETLITSTSSPEELQYSGTYPGAVAVFKYSGAGPARHIYNSERELKDEYDKYGLEWDPRLWPLAPSGPDSIAAGRYVGPNHNCVRFAFQFEDAVDLNQGTALLDRTLDWIATAMMASVAGPSDAGAPSSALPAVLSLAQNYPNPFNPITRIQIGIPANHAGPVSLKIYNAQGQLVKMVFAGTKPAGYHTFTWDSTTDKGSPVASGVYFANFVAGDTQLTRKMVLLK